MGLLRKQPKQPQSGEWVQPVQAAFQPAAGPPGSPGPAGSGGPPVPARLRSLTADCAAGDWLRGVLLLSPGSIQWQPDRGVTAPPVELVAATMIPAVVRGRKGQAEMVTALQTPTGQFELDMDPTMFEMTQELVTEAAAQLGPGDSG